MGCPNQTQETDGYSSRPPQGTSAFIVNSEIGAVLAVMRRNVRWGVRYVADDNQQEHSLITSFKEIRRRSFSWQHQWHAINPIVYLQPFLDVIQSDETSAPITGVALSSIYKFLTLEIICVDTVNVADALQAIVDAVTSCRFEVTDPASEEVVLMKILQVLLACMKNKASVKLSNQHVCNIVNTCFHIVHQASSKGELLQRIARHTMHELVRCIFSYLPYVQSTEQGLAQGGISHLDKEVILSDADHSLTSDRQEKGYASSNHQDKTPTETASNVPQATLVVNMDEAISEAGQGVGNLMMEPYGVPCLVEIFQFLCSLLNAVEHAGMGPDSNSVAYDEDVPLFALGLINSAIELSGSSLGHHLALLSLIQDDLFYGLMQLGLSKSALVLSTVCSIVLNLYHLMRTKLKLQLEAFFSCVLLRIAQSKHGASYQQQEVAMETLVDLCRQQTFIDEMYANFDCDISCSNVFEDLANLLSKSAFPVNGPLSAVHLLALDGLIAMIKGMAERVGCDSPVLEQNSVDLESYQSFWMVKCEDYYNPNHLVPFIHKTKLIKRKLMIGADHFNRDPKKGLEFLQGMHMLPDKLDPSSVASFFRYTTGLDKNLIGDYLGNHDEFCVQVLHEFARTFDFQDMNLDTALRVFLETFRLPGESQKIQRVLEAFAERYYEQSPHILANKDAALVLSYSLIMLNTDQHNAQVKKKMSEEDFIRNNRRINGGEDLPREFLSELYHSICENEIRMTPEQGVGLPVMTHSKWVGLIHKAKQTTPFIVCDFGAQLSYEMFAILSGPTLAALSVVYDHVEQEDVLQSCIDGFLAVAKMASCYHLDDVLDGLVVSLCRFTTLLPPLSAEQSVFSFGDDAKARMVTVAVFKIANSYGDYIRSAWKNVLDCIISLHKLGLLPARLASDAADDIEPPSNVDQGRLDSNPPQAPPKPPAMPRKSSGLMGRFSEFLYYDTEKPAPQPTEEEIEARQRSIQAVKDCHIDSIFTESKFLQSESLSQLARALILTAERSNKEKYIVEDEEAAIFCLELLITITLNNRDRIMLLWQVVYEHIANVVQSAVMPSGLVEKAVFGLLRICQRLLPYKENLTDELLKSLQLVLKLDARVADAYCENITQEVMRLVKANARQIKSHLGWRTITSLLSITARHPEASEVGFETLEFIMSDGAHLLPANYVLCVNAARQFAESRVGDVTRSLKSLDLMAGSAVCLVKWSCKAMEAIGEEAAMKLHQDIGEMWLRLVQGVRKLCVDQREEIRNHAILMLQRCLTGLEGIYLPRELWLQCFDLVLFTLVGDLLEIVQEKSPKEYRNMEGTLVLSLKLIWKVFLHSLKDISQLTSFCKVWLGILSCMERYMKVKFRGRRSEKIHELMPELLKNALLVMKSSGILIPNDAISGDSFWQLTWLHVKNIAPSLQSEVFPSAELEKSDAKKGDTPVPDGNIPVPSGGTVV